MTQNAEMGALPEIRAAVDPHVKGGEYYGPSGFKEMKGYPVKVQSNSASHNSDDARKLWEVSEKLTGVKFIVINIPSIVSRQGDYKKKLYLGVSNIALLH